MAVEGFEAEHDILRVIKTWMAKVNIGAMWGMRFGERCDGCASGTGRIDCRSIIRIGRRSKYGRMNRRHNSGMGNRITWWR